MRQWKQATLASFAGVSLSTIERIERGEPVSKESLDRVAVALGYSAGDFTTPRVPLGAEQSFTKLEESLARFADRVSVPVRPLRTQPQILALARCNYFLVDGSHLDEKYQDDIRNIREWLDLTGFILGEEKEGLSDGGRPVRLRQLYADVLRAVLEVERRAYAVALCGTYTAKTNDKRVQTTDVALVAFFPKLTDPGAIKREVLLAPDTIDVHAAWRAFLAEE